MAEGGRPAHREDEFHSLRQVVRLIPAHEHGTYFEQVATLTLLSAHDSAQELESQPHCEGLTHTHTYTYIHTYFTSIRSGRLAISLKVNQHQQHPSLPPEREEQNVTKACQ